MVSALERVQCFKDPAEAEARVALLSNTDRINLARLGCQAVSITARDPALKNFCRGQQGRLDALREAVASNATTEADEEDLEKLGRNRAWLLELSYQLQLNKMSAFRRTVQTDELYPNHRYLHSFQFNLEELMETNPALITTLITKVQVAAQESGLEDVENSNDARGQKFLEEIGRDVYDPWFQELLSCVGLVRMSRPGRRAESNDLDPRAF
ncbi:hypothetical protein BKA56DRAFT_569560 [Ilyonectria sp. MPI-CAGE-AT-0026]|nr:hypothetical protein BKA56DRAFT_569560 [Ilyonectria sp. MPI-CAGE-AT-0026]